MRFDESSIHWTEIYLIITVSALLLEDFRQLAVDYHAQMLESWHWPTLWIAPVYSIPYILFYIGIICHLQSTSRRDLYTAARIILAIDLELWYLFSLRFVSAIKLLGSKLFMIQNIL
ncbi:unnamed protein product, partial [Rotaria sp. Silwood2]